MIPSWGLSLISYYTTFQELVGKIPESRKNVIISGTDWGITEIYTSDQEIFRAGPSNQ